MSTSTYVDLVKQGRVYEATVLVKQQMSALAREAVLAQITTVAEACGMKKESDESDKEEKEEDESDEEDEKESDEDEKDEKKS